jgi:hypothetical protein
MVSSQFCSDFEKVHNSCAQKCLPAQVLYLISGISTSSFQQEEPACNDCFSHLLMFAKFRGKISAGDHCILLSFLPFFFLFPLNK